ncbi:Flp family type IVb pilin [Azoarcus sp. KH32C]|uniref:Flp family type IVb pilin n=1 Tax=Azoarcus sp. KH32C TaxID=748247 RepID=UPI00023867AA|nr:Flp family type IVb pilin [Azoarcus sp. KH32C]BAL26408.1 pilus assembly protein, pilin component [Azoarcus sp. KH32C]
MKTVQIKRGFNAFLAEQDGVTAIEYALLAALIFVVIVTAVGLVGTNVAALFAFVAGVFP